MSLIETAYILLGLFIGIFFTITFTIMKKKTSQKASATGESQVRQAGRDMVDIGSYTHTQTHTVQSQDLSLVRGEQIATSASLPEFQSQVNSLWTGASKYVHCVSLYGIPFMPQASILDSLLTTGVEVKMVLIDPDCPAAREIAENKCRFSRTLQHYEVLAQTLHLTQLNPDAVLAEIKREVAATIDLRRSLMQKHPNGKFSIRLIDFPPVWKGTIVDGTKGVYLIYDVPRMDVPFRYSDDRDILSYHEKHYFVPFWNGGRDILPKEKQ